MLRADSAFTITEKSTPIFRSVPDFSLGMIFVPRRFHISGGTVPIRRSVLVLALGLSSGGARGLTLALGLAPVLVEGQGRVEFLQRLAFKNLCLDFS